MFKIRQLLPYQATHFDELRVSFHAEAWRRKMFHISFHFLQPKIVWGIVNPFS